MSGRREFLKGSLAVGGAAVMASAAGLAAAGKFPPGLIFTKEAPGRWAGKEGTHAPQVTIEGRKIKVTTPHPMSEKHYIVRHTVLTPDGQLIGEKTFAGTDPVADSVHDLPENFKGSLWATSFCNLHDMWLTEFAV